MPNHSPEPCIEKVLSDPAFKSVSSYLSCGDGHICVCTASDKNQDQAEASLCRIIACVKACAGIHTETLETLGTIDRPIQRMAELSLTVLRDVYPDQVPPEFIPTVLFFESLRQE